MLACLLACLCWDCGVRDVSGGLVEDVGWVWKQEGGRQGGEIRDDARGGVGGRADKEGGGGVGRWLWSYAWLSVRSGRSDG